MEKATYIITVLTAVTLIGTGVTLCWRTGSNKAAVTAALSFGGSGSRTGSAWWHRSRSSATEVICSAAGGG